MKYQDQIIKDIKEIKKQQIIRKNNWQNNKRILFRYLKENKEINIDTFNYKQISINFENIYPIVKENKIVDFYNSDEGEFVLMPSSNWNKIKFSDSEIFLYNDLKYHFEITTIKELLKPKD